MQIDQETLEDINNRLKKAKDLFVFLLENEDLDPLTKERIEELLAYENTCKPLVYTKTWYVTAESESGDDYNDHGDSNNINGDESETSLKEKEVLANNNEYNSGVFAFKYNKLKINK